MSTLGISSSKNTIKRCEELQLEAEAGFSDFSYNTHNIFDFKNLKWQITIAGKPTFLQKQNIAHLEQKYKGKLQIEIPSNLTESMIDGGYIQVRLSGMDKDGFSYKDELVV